MKQYLEAGEFVTTHGIHGELRLYPWSDDAGFLTGFTRLYLDKDGKKPLAVLEMRQHKRICIVKLEGVESINEARPFIGKTVYINRDDVQLEEGRYFVQDLLGLRVVDADDGREYGVVESITHPGRHDVYEVRMADGEMALFPAVEPFLVATELAAGRVLVRPIPGMFSEAGE